MKKRNYRIRTEKIYMDKFAHSDIWAIKPSWANDVSITHHVERRFLWFWWIKESLYPSEFNEYNDAVFFVKTIRNGNLMFTI